MAAERIDFRRAVGIDAGAAGGGNGISASADPATIGGEFFTGALAVQSTIAALRTRAPSAEAEIVRRAARIASGDVEIFGCGWISIGQRPDWHFEPLARRRAPDKHWSRIPYLDFETVGDHKVLWEFNRHQQFVTLGQAWQYTRDERWVDAFVQQSTSWLDQNPPRHGVHWASSLEVAYRAISWCWAMHLFRDAAQIPGSLRARIARSIDAHGRHVERYLSTYFSPNTHLTGEALGLFYIGTVFPSLPRAAHWRRLASDILYGELARQVHPDGVYFEQATQYHRYTTEIYLHFLLLQRAQHQPIAPALTDTLHGLFDVLLALHRADGSMPLLGDDDGGKLVQLDNDPPHRISSLLTAGAVALGRADLAAAGEGAEVMALWLFGASAASTLDAFRPLHVPPARSTAFVDGGLYVVRDRRGDAHGHLAIDAGPHGAMSHGHSHADALAVELFAGGGPLFVDAGTFTYGGPKRNAFRAAAAHNRLTLDGDEGALPDAAPFRWRRVARGYCDQWTSNDAFTWFAGHLDASPAGRDTGDVSLGRSVFHPADGVWVISDGAPNTDDRPGTLRWLCAVDVVPTIVDQWATGAMVRLDRDAVHVATVCLLTPGGAVGVEDAVVSRQLGHQAPTRMVTWHGTLPSGSAVHSIVVDWTARQGDVSVRAAAPADARRLRPPTDDAVSASASTLSIGTSETTDSLSCDAAVSWFERAADGATERLVAIAPTRVTLDGQEIGQPGSARWLSAARRHGSTQGWEVEGGSLEDGAQ